MQRLPHPLSTSYKGQCEAGTLGDPATQFLKDVRQGAADRVRLRDELRATTCLVEMLNDRIDDSDDSIEQTAIKTLISPDGPLNIFKGVLEEILRKLKPAGRLERLSQPFSWPFDKKEILSCLAAWSDSRVTLT
ncbi:hypothetical protein BDV19DRAFT_363630 [Aspergillus venezuelensis]